MQRVFRAIVAGAGIAAIVAAGATASAGKTHAGIQACGLMPDTKTSVRWEQYDKPYLIKAFKAAGVSARVVNAQGDPQKQKTQADQCISDGAKVLIIAPIDSGSAAAIEKAAAKKGVKSIDYDRQVEGGAASLYVSFDGHTVGVLQGQGVVDGLKANGKYGSKPVVASLWGGQEDANSGLFKGGRKLATAAAKAAVNLVKGKKVPTTGKVATKGRSAEPAYLIAPQSITKANYTLLFTSGFLKKGDVCNGDYAQYCK